MSRIAPAAHPLLARRASGILAHVTSLPGPHGIGDLGPTAHRFVDWLERAGQRFWQTLPVTPVGAGNSPYSGTSAFAGEPLLVALAPFVREGLLPPAAQRAPTALRQGPTDYDAARRFKQPRFLAAFIEFAARRGERSAAYRRFVRASRYWLEDWCRYAAEREGGHEDFHAFVQFAFDQQWAALRSHALERGVRLIGDVPIFLGVDSADVRAHPKLFRLRRDGRPEVLTGVPPDLYSSTGQLWGQPHYRWPAHKSTRFRWWIERFARAARLADLVRIDHFIGFHSAYEVPGGAKDARRGQWGSAPGVELLVAVRKALGGLPLIAEDLGLVTSEVHALRDRFGLPGMRILEFAFGCDGSTHLPCMHPELCVAYPGTHDNETVRGWWRGLSLADRRRFREYRGPTSEEPWETMLRLTMQSPARLAIVQLQDALGLPPEARMNRPGVPTGNWTWRANAAMLTPSVARRLRALAQVAARLP